MLTRPPSHKSYLIVGDSIQRYSEVKPIGKLKNYIAECKYCHRKHHNWWMMNQKDYEVKGLIIILCGECEHTSAKERQ